MDMVISFLRRIMLIIVKKDINVPPIFGKNKERNKSSNIDLEYFSNEIKCKKEYWLCRIVSDAGVKTVEFPSFIIRYMGNPPGVELSIGEDCIYVRPQFDKYDNEIISEWDRHIIKSDEVVNYITPILEEKFGQRSEYTLHDMIFTQFDDDDIVIFQL